MSQKIQLTIITKDMDALNYAKNFFSAKTYSYFQISCIRGDILQNTAEVLVSSGNSYGMMDGGIDGSINYFLNYVDNDVKNIIYSKYLGECAVGAGFLVDICQRCNNYKKLAYIPTMKVPCDVSGTLNPYMAFRALLLLLLENGCTSACLSLFCHQHGNISVEKICHQYDKALMSIYTPNDIKSRSNWNIIWKDHNELVCSKENS